MAPQEQRRQVTELSELRQQLLALKSSALAQVDAQGGGWGWRVGEGAACGGEEERGGWGNRAKGRWDERATFVLALDVKRPVLPQVSPPGSPAGKQPQQSPLGGRHPPPEQRSPRSRKLPGNDLEAAAAAAAASPGGLAPEISLITAVPGGKREAAAAAASPGGLAPEISLITAVPDDVDAKDADARLSPRADQGQYSDITLSPRQYGNSPHPSSGVRASSSRQGESPASARASEQTQRQLGEVGGRGIRTGGENDVDRALTATQGEVAPPDEEAEGDDSAILSSEVAAEVSEGRDRWISLTLFLPNSLAHSGRLSFANGS